MGQDGFGDLVSDAHDGIEGGHGLLEDHGQAKATQLLQIGRAGGSGVAAFKDNGAGDTRLRRQESHDGQGGDAFSGAGFADEGESFTGGKRERNLSHGSDGALWRGELDGEVVEL